MSKANPLHGGARSGAGRPRQYEYVKVPICALDRSVEQEKFLFMVRLSDEEPTRTIALDLLMPCQVQGCTAYTTTGVLHMCGHAWGVRPVCEEHLKEGEK